MLKNGLNGSYIIKCFINFVKQQVKHYQILASHNIKKCVKNLQHFNHFVPYFNHFALSLLCETPPAYSLTYFYRLNRTA